jgi:4-hydroxy-tetrahydrodipicolinate reductase
MNIALIGYGNMGKEIEKLVSEGKQHSIVSITKTKKEGLDTSALQNADVAIDFTTPDVVLQNIKEVLSMRVPMVIGTTGWYDHLPAVEKLVQETKTGLVYGQNFSIGANIFFDIVAYTSRLMSRFEGYDVFGIETHHTGKKDSPSGTAKKLADIVLNNYPSKKTLQKATLDRPIRKDELHFVSVRGGRNFGRHEIAYDSNADEIRLIHQAWGRRGFAEGALTAAAFIINKKGLYNFDTVFAQRKEE